MKVLTTSSKAIMVEMSPEELAIFERAKYLIEPKKFDNDGFAYADLDQEDFYDMMQIAAFKATTKNKIIVDKFVDICVDVFSYLKAKGVSYEELSEAIQRVNKRNKERENDNK